MTAAEETAAQAELLENVIATAQRLLKAEKDKSKITPAYIAEKVQKAAEMFAGDSPRAVDHAKAVATLIQRFSHWMGKATTLKDNTGHVDWLTAFRRVSRSGRLELRLPDRAPRANHIGIDLNLHDDDATSAVWRQRMGGRRNGGSERDPLLGRDTPLGEAALRPHRNAD